MKSFLTACALFAVSASAASKQKTSFPELKWSKKTVDFKGTGYADWSLSSDRKTLTYYISQGVAITTTGATFGKGDKIGGAVCWDNANTDTKGDERCSVWKMSVDDSDAKKASLQLKVYRTKGPQALTSETKKDSMMDNVKTKEKSSSTAKESDTTLTFSNYTAGTVTTTAPNAYPISKTKSSFSSTKLSATCEHKVTAATTDKKLTVDNIIKNGWTASAEQFLQSKPDGSSAYETATGKLTLTLKSEVKSTTGATQIMASLGSAALAIAALSF